MSKRPAIPPVQLSRSSFENPPPKPRVQDSGYLTAAYPPQGQKAPSQKDIDRHRANEDSGLLSLLKERGIPMYDFRMETKSGKTTLTASNVQQKDLEQHYEWKFFSHIQDMGNLALQHHIKLRDIPSLHSLPPEDTEQLKLKIPEDWKNPKGSPRDVLIIKMLMIQLNWDIQQKFDTFVFCPGADIRYLPYPTPQVTRHEISTCPEDPALGVEWTMVKILAFPGRASYSSELDVERHVGSMLAGFFSIVDCSTSSNADVAFPTAIGCFGSFPRPDFASRLKFGSKPYSRCTVPWAFRPVVFVGEAKKTFSRLKPPSGTPSEEARVAASDRMAAQLACAVQPTLILLIIDAMNRWKEAKKNKPEIPFSFPLPSLIHGIAYDGDGVIVYGFFPRVVAVQKGGTPTKWGFGCTVVTAAFARIFGNKRELRIKFIAYLLILQRHATYLAEQLQYLQLDPAFAKCDEMWRRRGLGCHS